MNIKTIPTAPRKKLKFFTKLAIIGFFIGMSHWAVAQTLPAVTQPIPVTQLQGFPQYPELIQKIILQAAALTQLNLTYRFGSADPNLHGMDCSGTIHYLLGEFNLRNAPRSANDMYLWAKQQGKFHTVQSHNLNSSDFSSLKPGDLLFWSGTYQSGKQNAVTHVMLYLGKNKSNQPLMFGASDGRPYQGKRMWGVSVFDFRLPPPAAKSRFVGYGCIPNLTCP